MKQLAMTYAGAPWLRMTLSCTVPPKPAMSPLGCAVADALGLAFEGLYSLNEKRLLKARWDDEAWIEVVLEDRELATFDGRELTTLVVVCHDLGLRLAVKPAGRRKLALAFSWAEASPTLDSRAALIRSHYAVVDVEVDE